MRQQKQALTLNKHERFHMKKGIINEVAQLVF